MATRFYLRNLTSPDAPSLGEKSTALPVGTANANSGASFESLALSLTKGTSQASKALTGLSQTTHQDSYIARFTSDALAAQTISANTWTLAIASDENNANANSFWIPVVYVWRPGSSSVVGFVLDSDSTLGVEWGTTEDGQVLSLTGSSVTAQLGDVIVLECWRHAVQAMNGPYAQTIYFDGATDVTDSTTTDAASYLETPQNVAFVLDELLDVRRGVVVPVFLR